MKKIKIKVKNLMFNSSSLLALAATINGTQILTENEKKDSIFNEEYSVTSQSGSLSSILLSIKEYGIAQATPFDNLLTIDTSGSLRPVDTLGICNGLNVESGLNIKFSELDEIYTNNLFKNIFTQSLKFSEKCKSCSYKLSCGGGYLPRRWSHTNGFNNPSLYCEDIKNIYRHIGAFIEKDLIVRRDI